MLVRHAWHPSFCCSLGSWRRGRMAGSRAEGCVAGRFACGVDGGGGAGDADEVGSGRSRALVLRKRPVGPPDQLRHSQVRGGPPPVRSRQPECAQPSTAAA